ncbi:MAG: Hsp20 family protein [Gammaproteobacteria bacterium]|nr:Hsp20 family protein [Gammaproteobacteria bacterium]
MNTVDLTPLYRNSIGFDRFGRLLDNALRTNQTKTAYPAYNIEAIDEDKYTITLEVAGFEESELDIQIEKDVLTVCGKKPDNKDSEYLYCGINTRNFEQRFNLADYIEVRDARLKNGLLSISLVKEIPEAMKPKRIEINTSGNVLEHRKNEDKAA